MDKSQLKVKEFMQKAGQELPTKPTIPSSKVRELRARLILEEALETIEALGFVVALHDVSDATIPIVNDEVSFYDIKKPNLVEIADGCADIQVVTLGTTLACGIDQEPVDDEVYRSNMSKFLDGCYLREDGKVMKSHLFSPANIAPIIEKQKE